MALPSVITRASHTACPARSPRRRCSFLAAHLATAGLALSVLALSGCSGATQPVSLAAPVTPAKAATAATTTEATKPTAATPAPASKLAPQKATTSSTTTKTSEAAATTSTTKPVAATTSEASSLKKYTKCADLNVDYPHGVGRTGAVDHVAAGKTRVTNFTVNDDLYEVNAARDGDKDGIACES